MQINLLSDPNQPAKIVWTYTRQLADTVARPEDRRQRPMIYCGRVCFLQVSAANARLSGASVDIFRNRDLAAINAKDRDAFRLIWHAEPSALLEIDKPKSSPSSLDLALIHLDRAEAGLIMGRGHQVAAFAMSGISYDRQRASDWHYKHLIDHAATLVCLLQIDEASNATLVHDLEAMQSPTTPIAWQVFVRQEDLQHGQLQRAYLVAMLKD